MRTWTATSAATPDSAWSLMAQPARWHEWAPHIRGAVGLGSPEVEPGATGAVRLLGLLPVPAKVIDKDPGHAWTWQVGPARMIHRVEPRPSGCEVAVDLRAPGPLEPLLAATYGPVIALMMKRLARVAAQ